MSPEFHPYESLELFASSASVRVAREVVARVARQQHLSPSMVELLRLATSELVTNALVHGSPPFHLQVDGDDRHFTVAVSDASAREPEPTHSALSDPEGQGLTILQRISDDFGWEALPEDGKIVWFSVLRRRRP